MWLISVELSSLRLREFVSRLGFSKDSSGSIWSLSKWSKVGREGISSLGFLYCFLERIISMKFWIVLAGICMGIFLELLI